MFKATIDLEEAEVIFGKCWNKWSEAEWDEFLECLSPEQVRIPGILSKIAERIRAGKVSSLPKMVQDEMARIMGSGRET